MRSKLFSRLSLAVALAAVAVTIGLTAAARPAQALTNCTVSNLSVDSEEAQFLQLINAYRPAGAPDLTISVNLNRAASWMAIDLATRPDGVFSHTDSLGRSASTRGTQCDGTQYFGENILAGTVRDTAQEAFDAWKASSGHNTNMLNSSYRQIGIARYYNASSYYKWYWVTIFSTSNDGTQITPGSSTPTPSPSPSPSPSPTPSPTPPPSPACTAPVITGDYDTSGSGSGSVMFSWQPVNGATAYRVARRNGSSWSVVGTTSGTTYTGADSSSDPQWRVYVASGSCTPAPGPATVFDPDGLPPCTAPVITSDSDTSPSGAGTVTMNWNPVLGATNYRVARRTGSSWTVVTTVSGTSYTGADAADDPQWRIYVASGGCTPAPGPATAFDPT